MEDTVLWAKHVLEHVVKHIIDTIMKNNKNIINYIIINKQCANLPKKVQVFSGREICLENTPPQLLFDGTKNSNTKFFTINTGGKILRLSKYFGCHKTSWDAVFITLNLQVQRPGIIFFDDAVF